MIWSAGEMQWILQLLLKSLLSPVCSLSLLRMVGRMACVLIHLFSSVWQNCPKMLSVKQGCDRGAEIQKIPVRIFCSSLFLECGSHPFDRESIFTSDPLQTTRFDNWCVNLGVAGSNVSFSRNTDHQHVVQNIKMHLAGSHASQQSFPSPANMVMVQHLLLCEAECVKL